MSWAIGIHRGRDIGYGVPAYCDHPECSKEIDRGLSFVCGSEPYGGEAGCGLFFCSDHLSWGEHPDEDEDRLAEVCERCLAAEKSFDPKPDHPEWVDHKLTDETWGEWRAENPEWVASNNPAGGRDE